MEDEDFDSNDLPAPGGPLTAPTQQFAVNPNGSASDPDSPIAALKAATARLKAQRSGLSPMQQLSTFLVAYGRPTSNGSWQSSLSNASQALLDHNTAARAADAKRDDLISKYDLQAAHYQAQNQAANDAIAQRAAAAKVKQGLPPKLNPDETTRIGLARNYFPGVSDADLLAQNRLYAPQVTRDVMNLNFIKGAGAAGQKPQEIMPTIPQITDDSQARLYPNDKFLRHSDGVVYNNPFFLGGK